MAARSPARSSAGPDVMCSADAQLGGDDAGQGGLAEAGRAGEEQVVGGLAPAPGGLEDDLEVLLELGLADELVEAAGPEADLVGGLVLGRPAAASSSSSRIGQPPPPARPRERRAPASSTAASSPSSGRSRRASRDLVGAVAEAGERVAHLGPRPTGRCRAVGAAAGGRRRRSTSTLGQVEPAS